MFANFCPRTVRSLPWWSATAPRLCRSSTACSTVSWGGGLMHSLRNSNGEPSPSALTSRQSSSRGERSISGSSYSCICSHCKELKSRYHFPGRQRPDLPLLWKPFALEYHTVRRAETFESSLKKVLRERPVSTTKTTSSTVIEVSAKIVDTITFRLPGVGGLKIFCCSAVGMRECKGWSSRSRLIAEPCNASMVLTISPQPGMKIRMPPSSPEAWICSTTSCTKM
mmetsp:Transcript_40251/g.86911  ORF Transcript_40251/g.86911 Transcript_40251/m.86911 type:complete len:225 (-) Transcript_40251:145-819(-)